MHSVVDALMKCVDHRLSSMWRVALFVLFYIMAFHGFQDVLAAGHGRTDCAIIR